MILPLLAKKGFGSLLDRAISMQWTFSFSSSFLWSGLLSCYKVKFVPEQICIWMIHYDLQFSHLYDMTFTSCSFNAVWKISELKLNCVSLPITTACFKAARIALLPGMWPYHHVKYEMIWEPRPVAFPSSLKHSNQWPVSFSTLRSAFQKWLPGNSTDNTAVHYVSLSFVVVMSFKWSGMLFYRSDTKIFANDRKRSSVLPCCCRLRREKQIIVGRFLMVSPAFFYAGLK